MAALHFLPPTGDSRSGRRSLIPNISLLPLDEVPVHVPLRRPRPLRFERLRVGGEGKADANLTNFLSTCCASATPWGGSPPRPLRQKICYSDCTRNCPLCPLRAPRRFRNPKIGQQLGAQPTPRFRVMSEAMDRRRDRCRDRPIVALHFLLPTGD